MDRPVNNNKNNNSNSVVNYCRRRELDDRKGLNFQRRLQVTDDLVQRIGLEAELTGHTGCVNCLEWNETGTLLASGSDDQQIIVWDPFQHKKLHGIQTGHHGNIFSVKFLPNSNDGTVVSGAADFKIRVHDLISSETTFVCSCHGGRVKRLATVPNVPFMFWSAAEDGTVMQFDLRVPHSCACACNNVLINLKNHMGKNMEVKCLAINPFKPEMLAIGANDQYVRMYDRRMINPISYSPSQNLRSTWDGPNGSVNLVELGTKDNLPLGCAQYFVPGHLPLRHLDFKKRYRALASTYLTFSPDGSELLVNLGGEQIYLFDVTLMRKPKAFDMSCFSWLATGMCNESSNGYSGQHRNGTTNTAVMSVPSSDDTKECDYSKKSSSTGKNKVLPPRAEMLKQRANTIFEKQQYTLAINLYNKALQVAPESAVLLGNRAAGYMKRGWDGDLYAALRDCRRALRLDADHLKAHFRLARCLLELQLAREAEDCLVIFKNRFPDHAHSHACESLDRDIKAAIFAAVPQPSSASGDQVGGDHGENEATATSVSENELTSALSAAISSTRQQISDQEKKWRSAAYDYDYRYCGHCNTTTDIKEANYFGSDGQYIVAGSDDGSFFMWDRWTTNIVRVLRGDDSIVNCLQPHPTHCFMATSGIDPVVRLWSPRPQDGRRDDREVADSEDAALANQKRMNADPLEVMLMNMGYRIRSVFEGGGSGGGDDDDGSDADGGASAAAATDRSDVQCRPS